MSTTNEDLSAPVVSFDDEPLILVDSDDNVLGYKPKREAHLGAGVLHRAFSIFVFDADEAVVFMIHHDLESLEEIGFCLVAFVVEVV